MRLKGDFMDQAIITMHDLLGHRRAMQFFDVGEDPAIDPLTWCWRCRGEDPPLASWCHPDNPRTRHDGDICDDCGYPPGTCEAGDGTDCPADI